MTVTVSARHGHLNDEHQAAVRERAEKLLHFFDRLVLIEVTVDLKVAGETGVEVIATAEHKHRFVGHAAGAELMAVTQAAVDKARHQISHYKERLQDHRRDPSHLGADGAGR